VPWAEAHEMSESEAVGYLDAYAALNGIKSKGDGDVTQRSFRGARNKSKKQP